MLRKLLESFTATHITILALGAMFIPGALVAAVTTTAVSITDPNTGSKAWVDPRHAMYVNDLAAYANNPANSVKIYLNLGSACSFDYQVPVGKALIVTSIVAVIYSDSTVSNYAGGSVFSTASTSSCGSQFTFFASNQYGQSVNQTLAPGVVIRSGSYVTSQRYNGNFVQGFAYGYLIPSSAAPSAAELAAQSVGGPFGKPPKS